MLKLCIYEAATSSQRRYSAIVDFMISRAVRLQYDYANYT